MIPEPTKVLVIDDSAFNRQTITSMLTGSPGIEVVGRAGDGNEGLKQVFDLEPDVITLDLEMPRMDGFTFLRILMRRRPTPVIVISSYAKQENVFKALELGALDFIAKPTQQISRELRSIEDELVQKVKLVGQLRQVSLQERAANPTPAEPADLEDVAVGELRVACIGASTGGPPALKQVLGGLPRGLPIALVVSQHMPASFTATFAERLDRASTFQVREARTGDVLAPGLALVAPGAASMALERTDDGQIAVRIETPEETATACAGQRPRYVPSIDRMMTTAAEVAGPDTLGILLTGMGDDGSQGMAAIKSAGGTTVAESEDTAVIFGMPEAAIRTGQVDEVISLDRVSTAIVRHARRKVTTSP